MFSTKQRSFVHVSYVLYQPDSNSVRLTPISGLFVGGDVFLRPGRGAYSIQLADQDPESGGVVLHHGTPTDYARGQSPPRTRWILKEGTDSQLLHEDLLGGFICAGPASRIVT